ncbi:MAG TPA: peroxiredoxin [Candidatus Binatia bacterium]|nr:peroxiredoxin [Candidatus Binatia bacterium]
MARQDNIYELPQDLPIPLDDGACNHLPGLQLPSVPLISTAGRMVDLVKISGRTVVYCYPRTGRPDQDPPQGWNEIPGARGCTPQSCAFRDHYQELRALGAEVVGLSTQDTNYQKEAVERLHLPFPLLGDESLLFTKALNLPTFEFESVTLIRRLTLVIRDGSVERVFYPVFPPDKNADEVIDWLHKITEPYV